MEKKNRSTAERGEEKTLYLHCGHASESPQQERDRLGYGGDSDGRRDLRTCRLRTAISI
jgi:hypothetical protein